MKDKVDSGHRPLQRGGVEHASFHELDVARFESPPISHAKIVEDPHPLALLQSQGQMAADEAGAASDQNSHRSSVQLPCRVTRM